MNGWLVSPFVCLENAKIEAIETILEFALAKSTGRIKKIVVTGCLPQRYKDEILEEIPEIDAVVGTGSYDSIVNAVNGNKKSYFGDINAMISETKRIISGSTVSTYIKIAEGCDNKCAYCVIPSIRGNYRSRDERSIISEAKQLASNGYKELILVAQDITRYGYDKYGMRKLSVLLERLCEIEDINWIRLHYLYPHDIDGRLIDVISKYDKILKYVDMPIQHISDKILKKMNRRGTSAEIRSLIEKLRDDIHGVVIRTSLITGLPGEGDGEFNELCEFLRDMRLERAGVFAYSPEEGTPAQRMERPDADTALRRAELLTDIQSDIMEDFSRSRIGTLTPVLIESYEDGVYYGRSYAESPDIDGAIAVTGDGIELNEIIDVRLTGQTNGEPYGVKA